VLYFQTLALLQIGRNNYELSVIEEAVELESHYRRLIALDPDLQRLKNNTQFVNLLMIKVTKKAF
jgi:hypothetical protein